MQPSIYAGVVLVGVLLIFFFRNKVAGAWYFFALCQVFGATSVAELTALGGASLAVTQTGVIVLLLVSLTVVAPSDPVSFRRSAAIHGVGFALIAYTVIISNFGPRLFQNAIDFVAMRPDMVGGHIVATPLGPRSSNITHAAYLAGSFLTAFAVSLVFSRKVQAADFRNAVLAAGALHLLFGLIDLAGASFGQGRVLDFLRNANFSMVDQQIGAIKRVSGSLAEPSSYAAFGVAFAVFGIEEWVRSRRAIAGLVGLALWGMILASTSTTGILAAVVYFAILAPRLLISGKRFGRTMAVLGVLSLLIAGAGAYFMAQPQAFTDTMNFIGMLTVDKTSTGSAIERSAWSMQGWSAFQISSGLGTGAGSFRSSSFAFAVLGSLGVIGVVLMLIFIAQIVKATFFKRAAPTQVSAGWAALMALVPAMVNAPGPDPGFVFAMFAGYALHPVLARAGKDARAAVVRQRLALRPQAVGRE